MQPFLGAKIKPQKAYREINRVAPHLVEGESLLGLFRLINFRPAVDLLAVTDHRVLGLEGGKLSIEVPVAEARGSQPDERGRLALGAYSGQPMVFKLATAVDGPSLAMLLADAGASADPAAAHAIAQQHAAKEQAQNRRARVEMSHWPDSQHVGARLSKKASIAIDELCHDGDPWLILVSSGGAGVIAAWDDRLAVVKTGGWTGVMAGAMGGGRTAIFHYRDITGIEYNSGMVNGVLEILTPSFSGTANKDFWRSSTSGRNADSNDPWTLSNTLPLSKLEYKEMLPQINELRRRISVAKQPTVATPVATPQAPPAAGVAEELVKLAALHDSGVLTDAEFADAKKALIAGISQHPDK